MSMRGRQVREYRQMWRYSTSLSQEILTFLQSNFNKRATFSFRDVTYLRIKRKYLNIAKTVFNKLRQEPIGLLVEKTGFYLFCQSITIDERFLCYYRSGHRLFANRCQLTNFIHWYCLIDCSAVTDQLTDCHRLDTLGCNVQGKVAREPQGNHKAESYSVASVWSSRHAFFPRSAWRGRAKERLPTEATRIKDKRVGTANSNSRCIRKHAPETL